MAKDVIIALDFENKEKTLAFLDQFTGRKPFVKIGMELFYAEGPDIVREIKARGHKIFLDLKLHDIPNTVKKAMKVLYSRLYELTKQAADAEHAKNRRDQIGSGDRSERIRTYNFPQGRVTDHRINMTLYRLEAFLDGDMDEMIDALILAERTAQLTGEAE